MVAQGVLEQLPIAVVWETVYGGWRWSILAHCFLCGWLSWLWICYEAENQGRGEWQRSWSVSSRREKEKGLCLTVPFRAGSQRLSFLSLGPVFQSSCYLCGSHRLENKPLLSILALGDILYPNCGTSPVLWVCCSMLDYVCGDQNIWKNSIESGTWVGFFFLTFLHWRILLASDPKSQCYPDCLEFLSSNGWSSCLSLPLGGDYRHTFLNSGFWAISL